MEELSTIFRYFWDFLGSLGRLRQAIIKAAVHSRRMLQLNDILGRSVHVKQRPGLVDGILSLVLPPQVGTREGCFLQQQKAKNLQKHTESNAKIYKVKQSKQY